MAKVEKKDSVSQIVLGKNIKRFREKAGLTQEVLAEKFDISWQHLSNLERGKRFVTSDLLDRMSAAFNVSFADLFNENVSDSTAKQKNQAKRVAAAVDAEITAFHESIKKRILDTL